MATSAGSFNLTGCNVELRYDIISQSVERNSTTIRLYNYLNVTNNYIGWSSGSAWVHTYSQNIGTYYTRGSHLLCYKDFEFTHNNDGTLTIAPGYGISTTYVSGSSTATIVLPRIDRFAQMTDAINNPNDESEFWFKYNNPRNLDLYAWLEINPSSEHIATRTITDGGTSGTYTWTLTETERNQLRSKLSNANSGTIRIGISSSIGGSTGSSYIDRRFTIINANPTFLDYDVEDINATTVALTGSTQNNVINVNGYSNIKATIITSNKAEAIKEASMVKYRFAIGDNSTDISYSDTNNVSGTLKGASNGTYNVFAIDSRNNSTPVIKQATSVINYQKITIDKQNCSFVRNNNQVGENAILTLNGTFWNDNFGVVTNTITSVTYKLKKSDSSTWITGTTTITPTTSDNTFTFTGQIASDNQDTTWDLDSSYNLEVIVSDELSSASAEFVLNSAVPTMSLDKEGIGIMCAYNSSLGGKLQVDGVPIDVDIYSTSETKTNKIWKNNKPVYRKIIEFTNTNTNWVSIDTIANIDAIVKLNGYVYDGGGNRTAIPSYGNDSVSIYITTAGTIMKKATSYYNNKSGVLIIEYTKST